MITYQYKYMVKGVKFLIAPTVTVNLLDNEKESDMYYKAFKEAEKKWPNKEVHVSNKPYITDYKA